MTTRFLIKASSSSRSPRKKLQILRASPTSENPTAIEPIMTSARVPDSGARDQTEMGTRDGVIATRGTWDAQETDVVRLEKAGASDQPMGNVLYILWLDSMFNHLT